MGVFFSLLNPPFFIQSKGIFRPSGGIMADQEYTLRFPVNTFDDRQLLPAGTRLSDSVMDEIRTSSKHAEFRSYKLLEHDSFRRDILNFISQSPYHIIFSDQERTAAVLEVMGNVSLVSPVLESLDYFRHYDFYTYRHMLLVFALSLLLSHELLKGNLNFLQGALASPAHDFGKICIPLKILKKKTPLTEPEVQAIKHHTLAGFVLLSHYMPDSKDNLAARIARDHHERMDGSGYPGGSHLRDRMVEIVIISDIYDALISPRPYRPISYDNRTALEEISSKAEKGKISWEVVKALVACNRKTKPHFSECIVSMEKRGAPPPGNLYGKLSPSI
jgi:HD-GYP domain-containing protein (c-di-GMP phosphodiesterase class II)